MISQTALDNIRIVLVSPTHPGNIGATARAMKTMGIKQLYLVKPKRFPDPQADERAAHAVDILANAKVVETLPQALQGCTLAYGTSARSRALPWPLQDVRPAAAQAVQEAVVAKIAFVFGREHAGLTNEELELCQRQILIPTSPDYSSLNLAAAVQIVCYEIYSAWLVQQPLLEEIVNDETTDWATAEEIELFYEHLEQVMITVQFTKPGVSGLVMPRLRRLFGRARLTKTEINILRGFLTTLQKQLPS